MYLSSEKKKEFFAGYGKSETDTGSPEGQIAMFTHRINYLTEHLKQNKKCPKQNEKGPKKVLKQNNLKRI